MIYNFKFKLFALIIFVLLTCNLYALFNSSDSLLLSERKIYPIGCKIDSDITLIKDSLFFSGYMIFEILKDNMSNNDTDYFYCNIFFIENILNFKKDKKYYYNFEPITYSVYANSDWRGDFINDTTEYLPSTEEFKKFKNFYLKYDEEVYKNKTKNPFLSRLLPITIFKNARFWKLNESDSVGYFIFKCSLYTAILNYECKLIKGKIDILLPISEALTFEPINESDYFKESKWYPKYIK